MALSYHLSFPTGVFTSYSLLTSAPLLFKESIETCTFWELPGGPVELALSVLRAQVQSLIGELRFHKAHGTATPSLECTFCLGAQLPA